MRYAGRRARTRWRMRPLCRTQRLVAVDLEGALGAHSADAEHERQVAIYDLIEANSFAVEGNEEAPTG